jgi:hypothetical protein
VEEGQKPQELSGLQVMQIWERTTGLRLSAEWASTFQESPEVADLQPRPAAEVRAAAEEVYQRNGTLKLRDWLDRIIERERLLASGAVLPTIQAVNRLLPPPASDGARRPKSPVGRPQEDAPPASSSRSRGGKSRRQGEVWSAPVDGDLHKRISRVLGDKPEYP